MRLEREAFEAKGFVTQPRAPAARRRRQRQGPVRRPPRRAARRTARHAGHRAAARARQDAEARGRGQAEAGRRHQGDHQRRGRQGRGREHARPGAGRRLRCRRWTSRCARAPNRPRRRSPAKPRKVTTCWCSEPGRSGAGRRISSGRRGPGRGLRRTAGAGGGRRGASQAAGAVSGENPVPVAGTDVSRRAAEVAIAIGRACNALVRVLYVSGARTNGRGRSRGGRMRAQEQAILKDIVEIADRYDVAVTTAVRADVGPTTPSSARRRKAATTSSSWG